MLLFNIMDIALQVCINQDIKEDRIGNVTPNVEEIAQEHVVADGETKSSSWLKRKLKSTSQSLVNRSLVASRTLEEEILKNISAQT
jgi:hypothetical protein